MKKIILILICVSFLTGVIDAGTLKDDWNSGRFKAVDIPNKWIPSQYPKSIKNYKAFGKHEFRSIKIRDFISLYGLPSRVLTPIRGDSTCYMVYDLEDGYTIGVYIGSLDSENFQAAALFLPDGTAEGTIIK